MSLAVKLTEAELVTRKPIWVALSDLFLDTDVTLSYDYIVRVCAESRYTTEELKFILDNEVAPAVSDNLLSVAGEWAGFDEEWLVNTIINTSTKSSIGSFFFKPAKNIGFRKYILSHWENIEPKITERRKNP